MTQYHIFVHGLILDASIGVNPDEKEKTQKIRINVDLLLNKKSPPTKDHITEVVNYETIVNKIREILGFGHINLVETLADRIASSCLALPFSSEITIKVEKLEAFNEAESVGVEIKRKK